jgi:hypothetical protein
VQLDAHAVGPGGGMAEAVVADRTQPGGQDMTQEAGRELDAGQGERFSEKGSAIVWF